PAAATRFRPTEEMFMVLNQEVPPEAGRGRPGGGGFGRNGRPGADGREEGPASEREARGGGDRPEGGRFDPNMTPEERQRRMEERMASMTPEQRARFEERLKARAG